jgi:spore coat polysaccharide biosynthesis predicted glycosyltransferase SpsG
MRTFALAERAVGDGGEATLASVCLDGALAARMRRGNVEVLEKAIDPGSVADAAWIAGEAARRAVDWVVVDGYRFGAAYQEALRAAGLRVLFVDDYATCDRYAAQVVVNQNVVAAPGMYPQAGQDTRYLLGPRYALLRSEFASRPATDPVIPGQASRILITLGGADPDNTGALILDAVARMPNPVLQARVVVGPSNPYAAALAARAADDSRIAIVPPVDDMAPVMAWADLAITGAGGTVYELACLGIPTLVIAIAEPQRELASALDREGFAVSLGCHDALGPDELARMITAMCNDHERRESLSRRGRRQVDGQGAARVLAALDEAARS